MSDAARDHMPPRRATRVIGALALALAALIAAGVLRARREGLVRGHARDAADAPSPGAPAISGSDADEVADLLRRARGNPGVLIEAFAAWASDPQAQGKRRVVLGAMAAEPLPMARLGVLLAAAQASPLALDADPLRRDLVAAVSSVWTGPMVRKGRDLMFAEVRPRARQVVIASFVELALSDRAGVLDATQRSGLTSDFIDLYPQARPDQRPDVVAVVRRLGGDDTAELLQGHGLGNNSTLEHHLEHRRNVEAALRQQAAGAAH
jgi:hypothetical protein